MCLTDFKEKKVADTNIISYKNGGLRWPLFGRFVSQCISWEYTYKRYSLQEIVINVKPHRYTSEIYEGYHSRKYPFSGMQIFIIPKGSEYYEGKENHEKKGYVSSQIIWIGSILNPINWLIALYYKTK